MSTRSFIAQRTDGGLVGRYHHWDGYPTALAATLLKLVETAELPAMRKVLLEDHPAGFSTINGADTLDDIAAAGFDEYPNRDVHKVNCYCHGDRSEREQVITCRCEVGDNSGCDPLFLEWGYVLDDDGLTVLKGIPTGETKIVEGARGPYEQPGYVHIVVGKIPWDTADISAEVDAVESAGHAASEAAHAATGS